MGRINTILQDMESLEYFRNAVYSSYGSYTYYKYIEGSQTWYLYTELSPEILITYTLKKGDDEEAVFLADKTACDSWTPRKRVDAHVTDFDLAATEAEHYQQMGDHINTIINALDGYHPDITGTEHYHEHSEAITTIIGELDGYTNSVYGTEYYYAERNELYQTTSPNWREVLSLETSSVPAGDYHIGWNAELGCNNGNKIPYMQVEVDDETVIAEHTMRFAHNEGFSTHGGIVKVTLGSGTHTVDIDINASDSGNYSTKIKRARLEMWRVS